MIVLGLAVATPARQALRTAELLRAEVFRAVERDQHTAAEPLEGAQPAMPAQHIQGLVEGGLQVRGMHWVEHGADMIVGRDGGHAEQALAVRHLPPFLQRALVGEERLALHEEQRKGRQADIRHAVGHLAVPLVGKGRAGRANACQKGLKHFHADLNHTSSRSETHPSHQPFRIAVCEPRMPFAISAGWDTAFPPSDFFRTLAAGGAALTSEAPARLEAAMRQCHRAALRPSSREMSEQKAGSAYVECHAFTRDGGGMTMEIGRAVMLTGGAG